MRRLKILLVTLWGVSRLPCVGGPSLEVLCPVYKYCAGVYLLSVLPRGRRNSKETLIEREPKTEQCALPGQEFSALR